MVCTESLLASNQVRFVMKYLHATTLLASFATIGWSVHAQGPATVPTNIPSPAAAMPTATIDTPAQTRIASAKLQLGANPKKVQAFDDLTLAYLERARETRDPKYLSEASQALTKGLALEPNDFQLQKAYVALLLAEKNYTKAKQEATLLNHRTPDDVMTYGYLAEAEIALGETAAAEKNAQWMLNMRPNNVPGLLLGARLRALYNDPSGALDLLKLAYAETSPIEVEQLAWIANQIASVQIDSGHADAAVPILERAKQLFPNYPYTLENMARVRLALSNAKGLVASSTAANSSTLPASSSNPGLVLQSTSSPAKMAVVLPSQGLTPVPAALLVPLPTTTERAVHNAQTSVMRSPKNAQAYAALGAAYFQQARETGDVNDYELADKALHQSLDLVSSDFSAAAPLESLAEVCMGEHRFADALGYSQRALSLGAGDVSPFGIVGDADADMGNYDKAAAAYARLTPPDMTLAPRAAYARDSRLAYLSFIGGNTAQAIGLMRTAVSEGIEARLPEENLAWLYYELGDFFMQAGDVLSANAAYMAALETHPGDYRALAGLAKLHANNGRYTEAIELYKRAIAVVPMPIFVAELGDLYTRTGNEAEAKKQYQLVQYIGLLGQINQVLHNRDLALFYADHDTKLPEALVLARKEFEVRHDIYTWDALAWVLYKNGHYAEAAEASGKALQYGTRDALLLFHAGMIAQKAGDTKRARAQLSEALAINPHFSLLYTDTAQRQLAGLNAQVVASTGTQLHAQ